MRVTAEFEADSIKIWLLRHRGDNQAEIREQGVQNRRATQSILLVATPLNFPLHYDG